MAARACSKYPADEASGAAHIDNFRAEVMRHLQALLSSVATDVNTDPFVKGSPKHVQPFVPAALLVLRTIVNAHMDLDPNIRQLVGLLPKIIIRFARVRILTRLARVDATIGGFITH